jgi:hypothetical protein
LPNDRELTERPLATAAAASCQFKDGLNYPHHIRPVEVKGAISIVAVFAYFVDQNITAGITPATWLG